MVLSETDRCIPKHFERSSEAAWVDMYENVASSSASLHMKVVPLWSQDYQLQIYFANDAEKINPNGRTFAQLSYRQDNEDWL